VRVLQPLLICDSRIGSLWRWKIIEGLAVLPIVIKMSLRAAHAVNMAKISCSSPLSVGHPCVRPRHDVAPDDLRLADHLVAVLHWRELRPNLRLGEVLRCPARLVLVGRVVVGLDAQDLAVDREVERPHLLVEPDDGLEAPLNEIDESMVSHRAVLYAWYSIMLAANTASSSSFAAFGKAVVVHSLELFFRSFWQGSRSTGSKNHRCSS